MTEGIVQKVLKERIHKFSMGYYNVNLYNKSTIIELEEIQQELIEKIKEYLNSSDATTIGRLQTLRKLIGDSQQ